MRRSGCSRFNSGSIGTGAPAALKKSLTDADKKGVTREVINNQFKPPKVRRRVLYLGLIICLSTFSVFHWVLWPVKIAGDSMVPNYYDGQPTYINRLAYWTSSPRRGDVVGLHLGNDVCIKRIIGLPGEKIEFRRDTIVVNGRPLNEPYPVKPLLWRIRPVQLGSSEYFIMGDNRATSMLDAVPRERIIGKAMF